MSENIDTKNKHLTEIFAAVGNEYGYDSVNAEFMAFSEFKVTWQRSYKWADFRVSDSLENAPEPVLTELAESLFKKIRGDESAPSKELRKFVTAKTFASEHRPIYIARKNYLETDQTPIERVCKKYGLKADNVVLSAYDGDYTHKAAGCSVLMRVIGISDTLLKENAPESVIDFVVYHELQYINIGYHPERDPTEEVAEADEKFEGYEDVKQWLRTHTLYV